VKDNERPSKNYNAKTVAVAWVGAGAVAEKSWIGNLDAQKIPSSGTEEAYTPV
jgi:hypothetical protein